MSGKSLSDSSISIAKGICIVLMVMAHAGCHMWLIRYVYMFHMPFFFMISGYCLKETYFNDCGSFFSKRMKGLYWPYIKWSLLFLFCHNFFFSVHFYDLHFGYVDRITFEQMPQQMFSLHDFLKAAKNIAVRMESHEQLLGGYWFLKQLLAGSIIGFMCLNLLQCKRSMMYLWGDNFAHAYDAV